MIGQIDGIKLKIERGKLKIAASYENDLCLTLFNKARKNF
jgi:hypothetical protein